MKRILIVLLFGFMAIPSFSQQTIGYLAPELVVKDAYSSFGATLFMPAMTNLSYGYAFGNGYGLRLTAGYYPELAAGFHLSGLKNLAKSEHFESNFSVAMGYRSVIKGTLNSSDDRNNAFHMGGFMDMNFYGIFLEAGLGYMSGDADDFTPMISDNIGIMFQLGYIYRFND
ncbi:MAG: hypothetical protein ACLFQX_03915 [Candidatus Kapaibacterium sp.]